MTIVNALTPLNQRFLRKPGLYAASLALAVLSLGCVSSVAAPETGWPTGLATVTAARFAADTSESAYQDLSSERIPGGQLSFVLHGTPGEVLEMLLDFDRASGRRSWAREYRLLERGADRTLARWTFKGKLGIHPSVTIEFRRLAVSEGVHLKYRVIESSFGMRNFAGEYRLVQLEGPTPMTLLTESVFIDSGLSANASAMDIEAGLLADARLMKEWMLERLGTRGTPREGSAADEASAGPFPPATLRRANLSP